MQSIALCLNAQAEITLWRHIAPGVKRHRRWKRIATDAIRKRLANHVHEKSGFFVWSFGVKKRRGETSCSLEYDLCINIVRAGGETVWLYNPIFPKACLSDTNSFVEALTPLFVYSPPSSTSSCFTPHQHIFSKLVHFTLLIIRQLNLDPSNLRNDRPVSCLLFLSETLECRCQFH